jgi:hypothetical protein
MELFPMRDRYISLRRHYQPKTTRLAIVAESPPTSGRYFYDKTGATTEPLFAAVMKQLRLQPATKAEGLHAFWQAGWILVDATYQPVNALDASGRNAVILRDYPLLRDDLNALSPERVVLIKKNVCMLLEPKLLADGFHVLNAGRAIYFPSHGRQRDFEYQFAKIALAT